MRSLLVRALWRLPSRRSFSLSNSHSAKKISETVVGDRTIVEVVDVPSDGKPPLFDDADACSLCTCHVPVKVTYQDVLILEQFMRRDGTVLPQQLTGLCTKQQRRIERCVMQAHWAGLFPDRTHGDLDKSGYRRFNRHWEDDMDMYRVRHKVEPGIWYYIKRYPVRPFSKRG